MTDPEDDPIRAAREAGRRARREGRALSADPYAEDASAKLSEAWRQGWREADDKEERR